MGPQPGFLYLFPWETESCDYPLFRGHLEQGSGTQRVKGLATELSRVFEVGWGREGLKQLKRQLVRTGMSAPWPLCKLLDDEQFL